MLLRLVDYLKARQITAVVHQPDVERRRENETDVGVSSLMDTWLLLRDLESNGERNRGLYVLKSRGMGHSNQVREFVIASHGIDLILVVRRSAGRATGSAREYRENERRTEAMARAHERERKLRQLERRRIAVEAQIDAMRADLESEVSELEVSTTEELEAFATRDRGRGAPGLEFRNVGRTTNGA